MARTILGKKLGMTQIFDAFGSLVPVTMVEAGPNYVIQVKESTGKDGYDAVKIGFGDVKIARLNRPTLGVFKHAGVEPQRHVQEFRLDADELGTYKVGDTIGAATFAPGDKIDVTATSKGRGYQGVVKRHGFKGAKEKTHGTHEYKRHGGSIGCSAYPGRVIKGKKMAGQMGNKTVTVQNLEVVAVFADENLVFVKGSVPGGKNSILKIQASIKAR
ncbi:MAG: 50S ribosomal protein L3 [Proteobacteria bacterium]|nr:MAG: 50S ribosomal protein L3 [Pseudomonadota bacterium]